jgi:hypothetical protein
VLRRRIAIPARGRPQLLDRRWHPQAHQRLADRAIDIAGPGSRWAPRIWATRSAKTGRSAGSSCAAAAQLGLRQSHGTPQTERLIGAQALAAMKPSAILVNVARGRVVDEPALVAVLADRRIAAARIDCTVEEPLPAASPLWGLDNALITPHTAGETRRYENNVIDLLLDSVERIWRGESTLRNQVI